MPGISASTDRAHRQELIEAAALRLFAERGFPTTTVDDIVEAAGVTKPTLYRHFESKQELCLMLLERARDELIAAPLSRFAPDRGDPQAQLAEMLEAWLQHIHRHPDSARLLFTPISGDLEVERVQRDLHRRQRDTQIALLREFAPDLTEAEAEPLGEATRAGLAAVALWWLDHPKVAIEVPKAALMTLTGGAVAALNGSTGDA